MVNSAVKHFSIVRAGSFGRVNAGGESSKRVIEPVLSGEGENRVVESAEGENGVVESAGGENGVVESITNVRGAVEWFGRETEATESFRSVLLFGRVREAEH